MNSVHQKETRGSYRDIRKVSGLLLSLLCLQLAGLVFSTERATAGELELLVPAYGNPCCGTGDGMWNTLISTAQDASTNNLPLHLNIIFNPASGPGVTTDPNYYNPTNPSVGHQLVNLRNTGGSHVTIYGYVATNFGDFIGKPLSVIQDEIDRYQTIYPGLVDGIFLDEMSNLPSKVADYHTIYVHIKTDTPLSSYKGGPVIGNPGTQTDEAYLLPATQAADTLVNFENTGNEYLTNYNAPLWVTNYPPDRFAHLIHTQSSWSTNFLVLADLRNAGMLYVIDDAFPNPWDALTNYWTDEVSAIEAHNSAAAFSCVGFEAPMDQGAVTVKKHRALPLKAQLLDSHGTPITDVDIISPPVIQITFQSGTEPAVDVTDQALAAGQGTEGNQFVFSGDRWRFNLQTKTYTASGTYTIIMSSGDASEYPINPTCIARFVIE